MTGDGSAFKCTSQVSLSKLTRRALTKTGGNRKREIGAQDQSKNVEKEVIGMKKRATTSMPTFSNPPFGVHLYTSQKSRFSVQYKEIQTMTAVTSNFVHKNFSNSRRVVYHLRHISVQ